MTIKNYDLIVIGNGVLSYSTVFAIIQENPNLQVAIIGPQNKLGSASIAAGAMLACYAEVEKGGLDSEIARKKFELSRRSAGMWPAWAEQINEAIGEQFLKINFGTYVIHNTRADEMDDENFDTLLTTLKSFDEPHEMVDPTQIKGMAPSTESRTVRAVYIPREGSFPSERLAEAFEKVFAKSSNVELIDDYADKLKVSDGDEKSLTTRNGLTLTAKTVLIAAGAESQKFVDQFPDISRKIPRVVYGVGTGIVVKTEKHAPEKVIRTSNRGLACGVHVVPYDQDVCYIGASNFISPVPEYAPRMTSLFALLQSAMEQIHTRFYKAQVLKWVVGHRPTSIDTYPLLGETSIPGLWLMSGTKRDGIHMSPLYAQSLGREILGHKGIFDNPFVPERKLIHTLTKAEGIEKAVKHLKSAAYQHELRLPKAGWDDMISDMLRAKIEAIYEKCGIKDFGIPPEMLDMYKYGHAGHQS